MWPGRQLDGSHKLMWDSEQCPRRPPLPACHYSRSQSRLPLHQRPRTGAQTSRSAQHHARSRKTSWWYHCKFQSTTRNSIWAIIALLLEKLYNLTNNKSEGWWGSRWREYFKRQISTTTVLTGKTTISC